MVARVFPAAQEPSIITDSRLIGHHGLFNHEVKSIDIERLLSEQRKLEKHGQHGAQKKKMGAFNPVPTSSHPSPCYSTSDAGVADNTEGALNDNKADLITCNTKTQEICQEKENSAFQFNSQGSLNTPGQRPSRQLDLSSENDNVIFSSTDCPSHELTTKSKKAKPVVSETERESLLTPSGKRKNMRPLNKKAKGQINTHTLECTLKHQVPRHHETQTCGPRPNPLKLSSSPIAATSDSSDTQQQISGLHSMSNSVSTLAARLSCSLQLPLLSRRHLAEEIREVLLQALRESHGPLLLENLLTVQRRLSFATGPTRPGQGQDMGPPTMDTAGVWPSGKQCRLYGVQIFIHWSQTDKLKYGGLVKIAIWLVIKGWYAN